MTDPAAHVSAHAHLTQALQSIPLARSMGIAVDACDEARLTLRAPLAPNVNDKGCAFGGSLTSMLTLAGWGLIEARLHALGRDCDIYVQDAATRYLAPVWADFRAQAELAEGEDWTAFLATLAERGRARTHVFCRTPRPDGEGDACTLTARFVAIARQPRNSPAIPPART